MDKIFKNNTIMGIVAVVTLVLVGLMYWNTRKVDNATAIETPAPTVE